MKVNITKASAKDTKKDGSKMVDKSGKPFWMVGIQCKEYGDKWINGFCYKLPTDWEGKEMELDIYEEEYQSKKQLKFKFPNKDRKIEEMLSHVLTKLGKIEFKIDKLISGDKSPDYPTEPDPEGIPW